MLWSQRLLPDLQRALKERLRLRVLSKPEQIAGGLVGQGGKGKRFRIRPGLIQTE
jgi:hypothetical protein